jgi:hypothetical protein
MKCLFVPLAFIGFCCMPFGAAAQQQPSSIEREHLLDGQFKMISKTEDIPATVKQAFSKITRQPPFAMANPGQKFQVTDFVVDGTLPWRRLAFAGVQDDKWFVHFALPATTVLPRQTLRRTQNFRSASSRRRDHEQGRRRHPYIHLPR